MDSFPSPLSSCMEEKRRAATKRWISFPAFAFLSLFVFLILLLFCFLVPGKVW